MLYDDITKHMFESGSELRADIDPLVLGAGKLMLMLVVVREYLGRSPQDDEELARLVLGSLQYDLKKKTYFHESNFRVLRHATTAEELLAMLEGDPMTIQGVISDEYTPSLIRSKEYRLEITEDLDIDWVNVGPLAYIAHSTGSSDPDRKSTRLNSSHSGESRMPSSA